MFYKVSNGGTLDVSAPVFTRMYSNVASMTLNLSSYQYVFIAITYTNNNTYGVVINVKTGELSESNKGVSFNTSNKVATITTSSSHSIYVVAY